MRARVAALESKSSKSGRLQLLSHAHPQPRTRCVPAQRAATSVSKCSACGATVGPMEFHSCSQMAARSVEASFTWGSRASGVAQHPPGCACFSCA